MISLRTRYSLAQFLALQAPHVSAVLFTKYGADHVMVLPAQPLVGLTALINQSDDALLMSVIKEVVTTAGDLRSSISPKHRFDERWHDVTQCLLIDGYIVEGRNMTQADPSIADASPMEDDLITALKGSSLPRRDAIVSRIHDSAEAFRRSTPDYNAALTNARVAIETLAGDVASAVAGEQPDLGPYDASSALVQLENGQGSTLHTLVSVFKALGLENQLNQLAPHPTGQPDGHAEREAIT